EQHRSFIYEPGTFRPLVMLDGKGPKRACPFYYQLDHLGTPQELTDYSGEIVWSAKYSAYGKVTSLELATEDYLNQPLRFQGQYFDDESGLHYNRHRYYDPEVGRYLTPDPVKLAGGLNQYRYVPNPTGWVDPLGLTCNPCPGSKTADGPYSEIVPGGGLEAHEKRGGHFIEKHVDRTAAQLAQRLKEEPRLSRASTFYDRATAEKAMSTVISSNKAVIENFVNSKEKQIIINDSVPYHVGIVLRRKATSVRKVSGVYLLLRKDKKMQDGYRIHTGFAE
ncbi:RHS repeat-associated core domain-containing protein, partial [Pseudomonas sp. B20(2017)]|uniref:RHS repeat-associated core domain-containing protein n=2 Tax=unclassified Pseudomonas TaxID=196821 RepID=UPI0015A78CBB